VIVLDAILAVLSLAVLVPVSVLCVQVAAALFAPRRELPPAGPRPSVAILMPAHDEEAVIAQTLRSLTPQLASKDRLLVVADNCSDATARIARDEGAEVIEREDRARRGKGYALDFGVRHLAARAPEVVIVIDADCQVGPDAVDRLARLSSLRHRPVQALYEMDAAPDAGLKARIAAFAWILKNHVRPRGMRRLGLPCQLMGTGMAFPWELIRRAPLASGHIVEDVMLGVHCAREGAPPLYFPEVTVSSTFPSGDAGMSTQRTRWEHGHLGMMADAPRLFMDGVTRGDAARIALALDLGVPPLALLVVTVTVLAFAGIVLPGAGAALAFAVGAGSLAMLATAILVSWHRWGRDVLSASDIARIPLYVLWKIPIYLRFLTRRESRWIRSKRGDGG